ncbi:esterase/lipase family protein [Shewanella ulleungensis]|uniref:esterase/lipase family protein n=1 Tax=Shewanella ulleungensis TaxID=2282699 RepID=UPI00166904AE|nr:alpha/beta hydrolase [Shewanella ulleungensis]MCL1148834.1 alpha/beta hydrolase [Shewanella ulleungensis]
MSSLPTWNNLDNADVAKQCQQFAFINNSIIALSCANTLLTRNNLSTQEKNQAVELYNHSLQQLVNLVLQQRTLDNLVVKVNGLNLAKQKHRLVLTSAFNILEPRLKVTEFGELGVLAIRERDNTKKGQDKFYPSEGIFRSVNFQFDSLTVHNGKYVLKLHAAELSSATDITKGNNQYQQKYSPAAAYLSLLQKADIDNFSVIGVIHAAKAEFRRGVFAVEPISTTKIPIIMIHGLNSDPIIWRYLTMVLLNDQQLSNHFQIWHLYYPSGPPPFFTSMKLKQSIDDLLSSINQPNFTDDAVFIGHSMGGIVTNVLTTDSEYALWDAAFIDRPEMFEEKPDRDLENIFIFKPIFKHNTVFFLDTPHRGSEVATSTIGYFSSALVNLPQSFLGLFQNFTSKIGLEKMTKAMQPFMEGPNSIQVLRPGHPLMNALNELPIAGEAYSIIGTENDLHCLSDSDCSNISDGVVNYNSAHIDQAKEDIIVPSTHNSFQSEQAIEFIKSKLLQLIK